MLTPYSSVSALRPIHGPLGSVWPRAHHVTLAEAITSSRSMLILNFGAASDSAHISERGPHLNLNIIHRIPAVAFGKGDQGLPSSRLQQLQPNSTGVTKGPGWLMSTPLFWRGPPQMACSQGGPWQGRARLWAALGWAASGGIHLWLHEPHGLGQWTEPQAPTCAGESNTCPCPGARTESHINGASPLPSRTRPRLFSTHTACREPRAESPAGLCPLTSGSSTSPSYTWVSCMAWPHNRQPSGGSAALCHRPLVPRVQLRNRHPASACPAWDEGMTGPLLDVSTRCFSTWSPKFPTPRSGAETPKNCPK